MRGVREARMAESIQNTQPFHRREPRAKYTATAMTVDRHIYAWNERKIPLNMLIIKVSIIFLEDY